MTDEIIDSGIQAEPEPKVGPGRNLREMREARHLTQEAVAKQLRIDIALVRALEEDDYGRFAAPIYVTGYLRAYARLLDLAPEPYIEAYQNLGAVAAAPSLERVAHLGHQAVPISTPRAPRRWVAYVLAVVAIGVVIMVWQTEAMKLLESLTGPPLQPEISLQSVPNSGGESVVQPVQGTGETQQQALPLPLLPPPPSAPNNGEAVHAMPPAAVPTESPAPAVTQHQPQSQTQVQSQHQTPPQSPPDSPHATIDLKAEKPSWVEVKDGSGARLFYDLMVPGDEESLEGVPPFDVLLGYAPGVIVKYNGTQVDPSAYTFQDMARFRVSDKGAIKN